MLNRDQRWQSPKQKESEQEHIPVDWGGMPRAFDVAHDPFGPYEQAL